MAKDAGMKCIVITAKQHDGFALFDLKSPGTENTEEHLEDYWIPIRNLIDIASKGGNYL
jgi:hypothetical protein